jgi:hypothetical protein
MNDHVFSSRDDHRARDYSAQIHRLNHEPVQDKRKPMWRRRAVAGAVLGSMAYLVTSCFVELRLHKPKIDRASLRFGHTPNGK